MRFLLSVAFSALVASSAVAASPVEIRRETLTFQVYQRHADYFTWLVQRAALQHPEPVRGRCCKSNDAFEGMHDALHGRQHYWWSVSYDDRGPVRIWVSPEPPEVTQWGTWVTVVVGDYRESSQATRRVLSYEIVDPRLRGYLSYFAGSFELLHGNRRCPQWIR